MGHRYPPVTPGVPRRNMKDSSVPDGSQGTTSRDDSEMERQRREVDDKWEKEEAQRREDLMSRRVQENWRNRYL